MVDAGCLIGPVARALRGVIEACAQLGGRPCGRPRSASFDHAPHPQIKLPKQPSRRHHRRHFVGGFGARGTLGDLLAEVQIESAEFAVNFAQNARA